MSIIAVPNQDLCFTTSPFFLFTGRMPELHPCPSCEWGQTFHLWHKCIHSNLYQSHRKSNVFLFCFLTLCSVPYNTNTLWVVCFLGWSNHSQRKKMRVQIDLFSSMYAGLNKRNQNLLRSNDLCPFARVHFTITE